MVRNRLFHLAVNALVLTSGLLAIWVLVAPGSVSAVPPMAPPIRPAEAAFTTVNTTDDSDDGACTPTHCSLREAINAANADAGLDTIVFNIPGEGPHSIKLTSGLPSIEDSVIIDGYTQPGASPNSRGPRAGLNTVLMIELNGTDAEFGLIINRSGSTIRGLAVNRFDDLGGAGILVQSEDNVIEGNFISTGVTGQLSLILS